MKTLKIYYIDDDYINYLLKYDAKVPFNKTNTRPYVGVVYRLHGNNYFAPLSSPKPKHMKMSDKMIDVFKIEGGTLGVVNINNMIPTPLNCLREVLPSIKDKKYKTLLIKQITYINDHKHELLKSVMQFYSRYAKGFLSDQIMERCCDFKILEEKCKDWERQYSTVS